MKRILLIISIMIVLSSTSCKNTQSESFYITNDNVNSVSTDEFFGDESEIIHTHKYNMPTCTEPAICSICNKEIMPAKGHRYKEATCTEPETCVYCGYQRGKPLGHNFVDGYCTECNAIKE